MIQLIYRQLRLDHVRSLLTGAALAAVVAAILMLEGFYAGLIAQLGNTVLDRGGDLIVTQSGVSNMTATRSILPQFARQEVEAVHGVTAAHPLTGIPLIYTEGQSSTPIFLLVYDLNGGPKRLVSGHLPEAPRDIIIDRSLAIKYGLLPGDSLKLSGFEFRVSGVSEGEAAFFTPFGFAHYDDLIDFYLESDVAADISTFPLLSFLLVDVASGIDVRDVAQEIESNLDEGDVFLPRELAAEDEDLGRVLFGPVFKLLISVGYLVGILVTAIIMFATINARRKDFGVLKALGFGQSYLTSIVLLEAVVLVLASFPLGVVLASLVARAVEATMPLYLILAIEPAPILRTLAGSLIFAVLGAMTPIRLIRRLDPSMIFRS